MPDSLTEFHQQAWSNRFGAMGDTAEGVFEQVWGTGWVRFGLNRPPIRVDMLPLELRYTPDYLTSACLVEVQGYGKAGLLRIKAEKLEALRWWHAVHPVALFVYDQTNHRWTTFPLEVIAQQCEYVEPQRYPEGTLYYPLVPADITDAWVAVDP